MAADLADLDKVWDIRVLKKERSDEARRVLEQVAKQVQPIMRKRKWKVRMLSEFSPANPALLGLNVNRGQEVKVRLRPHGRDSDFFPWEHILGTMLHELTHNEVGPHNANFYKLLDEITREFEDLMAKGIAGSGQGFDARGLRLGGVTHNPPPTNLRSVAAAAAEKRLRVTQVMSAGPRKLGGDRSLMRDLPPGVAAAMAAERRAADDKWCAGASTAQNDSEEAGIKASQEVERGDTNLPQANGAVVKPSVMGNEKVSGSDNGGRPVKKAELTNGVGDARQKARHNLMMENERRASDKSRPTHSAAVAAERRKRKQGGSDAEYGDSWACSACTLQNHSLALQCGVCGSLRNSAGPSTSLAAFWNCHVCTLENPLGLQACGACGTPRRIDSQCEQARETAFVDLVDSVKLDLSRSGEDGLQPGDGIEVSGSGQLGGGGDRQQRQTAYAASGSLGEQQRGWTCKFCTLRNELRSSKCAACDQWRYSNGVPLAHRPVTET